MGSLFSQNKFFIILGGVALALAVWYSLTSSSGGAAILSAEGGAGPGQEVVDILRQLDAVKLDGTIFSEPAFVSLKDFSTQIVPEPVGRQNPFAPLDTRGSPSATSTKAAQIFAPVSRTSR